jgi:predicted DNA-binding mobile mystery protein A
MILDQLNRKLEPFEKISKLTIPEKGWIYTIRKSLNMTLEQLGKKIKITRQGIKKIEEREASGSITLNTLREIGEALDMKLIYGFSSKYDSIDQMVDINATKLATKIVLRTHQNMQLENQANSDEQIKNAIIELSQEIKREMRKSLWD